MRREFWMLLLLLPFLACATTLEDLQQRFSAQPLIRAHFVQVRTIKGMEQPLRSQGEMLIARGTGLLWDQQTPFPMYLTLDDSRMVQSMGDQAPQIITAQNNPQLFQFNHLLRALFQADRQALQQNFALNFQDLGAGAWSLRLVPLTTPLDKIFSAIDLSGKRYLDRIQLHDRQGDSTDITLTEHRITPTQLTDDERQRFTAQ